MKVITVNGRVGNIQYIPVTCSWRGIIYCPIREQQFVALFLAASYSSITNVVVVVVVVAVVVVVIYFCSPFSILKELFEANASFFIYTLGQCCRYRWYRTHDYCCYCVALLQWYNNIVLSLCSRLLPKFFF
jgi:hypothetical protein